MHSGGSPGIPLRPPRALPTTSSHPHHAASQKRPPRVETGKTGATQSISKAVRGLPIVERRGSIVPPTPSRPHHAASQKRPPRAETRKTGPAQSMSKAVRGLPIVERRGSSALGLRRAPGPFHHAMWAGVAGEGLLWVCWGGRDFAASLPVLRPGFCPPGAGGAMCDVGRCGITFSPPRRVVVAEEATGGATGGRRADGKFVLIKVSCRAPYGL
jgi:hypothetical protein